MLVIYPVTRKPAKRFDGSISVVSTLVDARAGRTAPHRHLEPLHRVGVALRDHLDAAVVLVAHVAADAFAPRRIFDEEPEPDPLDAAPHDVTTPDEHEGLYRCDRVRAGA